MKASPIRLVALLGALGLTAMHAAASPRAAEASGAHYLLAADNLGGWHLGGFYRYTDREVNDSESSALKQNKFMMHAGHDLLSWISIYGYLGSVTAKVEPWGGENDPSVEYGGGIWANLLDHDLLSNLTLETRLRLQALAQISAASPEINGQEFDYVETYGSLTLSVVNELIGNKRYWPEAIGLFFGPVYNDISFDDEDYLELTGSTFGLTGGLDIYLTRKTTLSLAYEAFDNDKALNAALNFRF